MLKNHIRLNAKLGDFLFLNTNFGRGRRLRRPEKAEIYITGCRGRQPLRVLRLFLRETNDGLDMGHKVKRYILMPKMRVVTTKGIYFITCACSNLLSPHCISSNNHSSKQCLCPFQNSVSLLRDHPPKIHCKGFHGHALYQCFLD